MEKGILESEGYQKGLNHLQYDLLYGNRYAYHGEDLYPATELVMGVEETSIVNVWPSNLGYATISGKNFTRWSKIYVNDKKVPTTFINSSRLRLKLGDIKDGDVIVVSQVGSGGSRFRDTQEFVYTDPNAEHTETELTE